MPSSKCWWIGGVLILVGLGSQAGEGFWPQQGTPPFEAHQRLTGSAVSSPEGSEATPFLPTRSPSAVSPPSGSFLEVGSEAAKSTQENLNTRGPKSVSKGPVGPEDEQEMASGSSLLAVPGQSGHSREQCSPAGIGDSRSVPLRLGPAQASRPLSGVSGRSFDPTASTLTVLSSLAVVVGVFLLLVWAIRRAMPRSVQLLPKDVVEVLGRAPLMGKQQMYLLRCGPKLLLISVTPETAEALTEIEHPDEVARMVALCRENQSGSIPGAFRQILDQMTRQPSRKGNLASLDQLPVEPAEPKESPEEEAAYV